MKPFFSCLAGCGLLLATAVTAAEAPGALRPSGAMLSNTCAGCHGTHGRSVGAAPPIIGIPQPLFIQAMIEFKSGARPASVMDRIAKGYQDEDFAAMAEFFAAQ